MKDADAPSWLQRDAVQRAWIREECSGFLFPERRPLPPEYALVASVTLLVWPVVRNTVPTGLLCACRVWRAVDPADVLVPMVLSQSRKMARDAVQDVERVFVLGYAPAVFLFRVKRFFSDRAISILSTRRKMMFAIKIAAVVAVAMLIFYAGLRLGDSHCFCPCLSLMR